MKILAWNLNHRTIEKPIPPQVLKFFANTDAEMIVLNEFVDGESRKSFKQQLGSIGYEHQLLSEKRGKQNRVLIASKSGITKGDLNPPQQDDAAVTNFLHVVIDGAGIEVVGMRAPAYKTFSERQSYWQELATIMRLAGNRRIVFVGDINYDPFQGVAASVSEIRFDLAATYSIPNPKGEWSYISLDEKARTRIDHAFVAERLKVSDAQYLSAHNGIALAGGKDSGAVTDHAVLVLDLKA